MRSLFIAVTAAGMILLFAAGVLADDATLMALGLVVIGIGLVGFGWVLVRGVRYDLQAGHHLSDDELERLGVSAAETTGDSAP